MWLFRYASSKAVFEQALAGLDKVPASETKGLRDEILQGLEEASLALQKEESSVARVQEKKALTRDSARSPHWSKKINFNLNFTVLTKSWKAWGMKDYIFPCDPDLILILPLYGTLYGTVPYDIRVHMIACTVRSVMAALLYEWTSQYIYGDHVTTMP